jgi:hypothetical protein
MEMPTMKKTSTLLTRASAVAGTALLLAACAVNTSGTPEKPAASTSSAVQIRQPGAQEGSWTQFKIPYGTQGLCLEYTPNGGYQVVANPCDSSNANQLWTTVTSTPGTPPTADTGWFIHPVSNNELCLTNNSTYVLNASGNVDIYGSYHPLTLTSCWANYWGPTQLWFSDDNQWTTSAIYNRVLVPGNANGAQSWTQDYCINIDGGLFPGGVIGYPCSGGGSNVDSNSLGGVAGNEVFNNVCVDWNTATACGANTCGVVGLGCPDGNAVSCGTCGGGQTCQYNGSSYQCMAGCPSTEKLCNGVCIPRSRRCIVQ